MAFDISEVLKDVSTPDTARDELRYLPYASLLPDIDNGYSMDGIEELARSIELVGLQQPLRVREVKDGGVVYMLISGHRRHAAIGKILKRNPDAFPDGIPCIIDRGGASAALQELKLLLGNADNRKLTPADEAQQLERMSDCIRRLENEGYQFPGRHRDWLSKMSGMSKSKIGRLEAIRKHLSTTWLKLFTDGKLPESVAYAMQQIPEKYQEILYELCVNATPRQQPSALTEYTAKSFAESVSHAESMVCTLDGGAPCAWKEQLIRAGNPRPGWVVHYGRCSAYNRCSACCSTCDRLAVCESVCPRMREKAAEAAKKKAQKDAKAQAEAERARAASRERFEREHAERIAKESKAWARLGARRRELGLSCADAYGLDIYDEEDIADVEGRENGRITGESWQDCLDVFNPEDYCAMANRLHCSIDYLMGRARDPEPAAVPGTDTAEAGPSWQTGEPSEAGPYVTWCYYKDFDPDYEVLWWDAGGYWAACEGGRPAEDKVLAWSPVPSSHAAPADPREAE